MRARGAAAATAPRGPADPATRVGLPCAMADRPALAPPSGAARASTQPPGAADSHDKNFKVQLRVRCARGAPARPARTTRTPHAHAHAHPTPTPTYAHTARTHTTPRAPELDASLPAQAVEHDLAVADRLAAEHAREAVMPWSSISYTGVVCMIALLFLCYNHLPSTCVRWPAYISWFATCAGHPDP